MITFEQLKDNLKKAHMGIIKLENEKREKGYFDKTASDMIIQKSQSYIENIEEVAAIEIGAETNSLIEAIQTAYQRNSTEYWQNFEKFIDEYVLGLTSEGKLKSGFYLGQNQCLSLGITSVNDLLCFKGRDPMKAETCDLFRQFVNNNYGTNIPMSGVEQQAKQDYEAVASGKDEIAKAQAFIHLKEVQRDSGKLKNGGFYYILSSDKNYQDAKTICAGRSL